MPSIISILSGALYPRDGEEKEIVNCGDAQKSSYSFLSLFLCVRKIPKWSLLVSGLNKQNTPEFWLLLLSHAFLKTGK